MCGDSSFDHSYTDFVPEAHAFVPETETLPLSPSRNGHSNGCGVARRVWTIWCERSPIRSWPRWPAAFDEWCCTIRKTTATTRSGEARDV